MDGRWQIGEWKFRRCPLVFVDPRSYDWMMSYRLYKNSILPNSGGWLDQSYKFINIITWLDSEINKFKEKQNGKK